MTHTQSYKRLLHKMGYYDYQYGLIRRHVSENGGWDEHLKRCRSIILKAIDLYDPSKITVLGSGWLLEFPLAEIIEKTREIILIDIIHPPEVIAQTSGLKNVHLVEDDISGGLIAEVFEKTAHKTIFKRINSLESIVIPQYCFPSDPGMVISLNILTQLESLPLMYLKKTCRIDDAEYMKFRKEIQQSHLRLLENHESVLISDIAEIFTVKNGEPYEEKTAVIDLPVGRVNEEWIWDFDPEGLDYNRKKSVLKVSARIY